MLFNVYNKSQFANIKCILLFNVYNKSQFDIVKCIDKKVHILHFKYKLCPVTLISSLTNIDR